MVDEPPEPAPEDDGLLDLPDLPAEAASTPAASEEETTGPTAEPKRARQGMRRDQGVLLHLRSR